MNREGWEVKPPYVDPDGFFFSGATIEELARNIVNKYQRKPTPPSRLADTVAKYNSFVDAGKDADFGKPSPKYKIQTPPFYEAWSTPIVHDTRSGLRINAKGQVIDLEGNVIPGLYAAANPRVASACMVWRAARPKRWPGHVSKSRLTRTVQSRRDYSFRALTYDLGKADGLVDTPCCKCG